MTSSSPSSGLSPAVQRLREEIAPHPVQGPAGALSVTISVGVASAPDPAIMSPEGIIAAADRALYHAKARGRNRVEAAE